MGMQDLDRRSFIKGAVATGALAATSGLVGCGTAGDSASAATATGHVWEVVPDPISPENISEIVETDIVVIGAGTAGVVAAHSAAEAGAKVTLIEKMEMFSARGHDVGAVGTKLQQANGVEIDINEMRDYYAQITCNKTNLNLFNIWASKSGEVLDYYIDKLAEVDVPSNAGSISERAAQSSNPLEKEFATAIQFGLQQKTEDGEYTNHRMVRHIEEFARNEGADIRYSTKAEQLIREGDDGPVTGVIASLEDGSYIQFNAAKGVILATGGITNNEEMLQMWAPPAAQTEQVLFSPLGGNTGDGLCMGMWIGAAHQKTNQATMALPSSAALGGPLATDGRGICWLMVNTKGERYVRENSPGPNLCHATLPQPESKAYSIYDGNYAEKILLQCPDGVDFRGIPVTGDAIEEAMQEALSDGLLFKADTLEELATAMGASPETLTATVERYNSFCEAGLDEDYSQDPSLMFSVDTPPFYASRVRCGVLVVIYGLNVDSHSQVCDADDNPIGNLYAIGNVQGNFFTDSYPILIPGLSHGRCVTFGRLVGQALANGTQI